MSVKVAFQGVALEVTRMHNRLDASLCLEVVLYVFVVGQM